MTSRGATSTTSVAERLAGRREVLAREALHRIVRDVPVYAQLPKEQIEGEILEVTRAAIGLLLHCIATGEQPGEEIIAALRASAVRRAEERIPLEGILGAYRAGSMVVWNGLADEATADEAEQLAAGAATLIELVHTLTTEVAAAYMDEHRSIHSEEREADRVKLERLLGPHAVRPEGWPADGTLVVAELRLGRHPDEDATGVEGAVASRRKVRRLEGWLRTLLPTPAMTATEDRATVALPAQDLESIAAQLHAGCAEATGVEVLVAAVQVEDEGPGHARRGAALLAELADRAGMRDRAVLVDDLLVPYLVARVPEVRRRALAARERLVDGPDLLETLDAWFAHDFDRRATAGALHVHPNTLDHRLRRIGERLGVELGSSSGVELAAMVAAVGDEA